MQIVRHSETTQLEFKSKDRLSLVRAYFGEVLSMNDGPQAFLVDMPGIGSVIEPHFHDVDQYQVVVRGGGRLGPGQVGPVAFHYADAYTPYGPIIGAEDGIAFFTIRTAGATGFFQMPESRHLLPGRPGRNIAGQFDINKPLPAANQVTKDKLLEAREDNVLVIGMRMGPDAAIDGEPTSGGDQYYLVCSGSLVHEGKDMMPMTLIRLQRGDPIAMFKAGSLGAEILMLQLPMPTARVGSDPKQLAKRGFIDCKVNEGTTITASAGR